MKKSFIVLLLLCVSTLYSQIQIENAFPNLSFTRPVDLQHPGDGTDRLFVVSQNGIIYVFENNPAVTSANVFLNIQSRVNSAGNEEGLLGLAFHPDYAQNGYFFVYYSAANPRRSVIARYQVNSTNPNAADPNSELVILQFNQPFSNHNGGQIAFGPDGYLYIASGDGGSGGDPQNNAQNRSNLLGKILRIDVNNNSGSNNYAIPSDNPFAGNTSGWREEIFAIGLRNPWRFSFDVVTGWIWCGDVGQNAREEINIIENGKNYGWRIMEGDICYNPPTNCDTTGLTMPVWVYGHNSAGGYSITGGYVYHGLSVPELNGKYIYGDYVSRRLWALSYDGVNPTDNQVLIDNTGKNISSFGVDKNNELYILGFDGAIHKFVQTAQILAPTNLIAAALGPTTIKLDWNDNSNNELGFRIERKNGFNGEFILIDSVGENITSYTDNSVSDTTLYYYRVYAYNAQHNSAYSNIAQVTTPVPVQLVFFSANLIGGNIIIEWKTASEKNNAGFYIERKIDENQNNWDDITYIVGNGTTSEPVNYSYLDNVGGVVKKGNISYRLRQIDYDGTFTHSGIVTVNVNFLPEKFALLQNYPNPFNPVTVINYHLPVNSNVILKIYDSLGNEVSTLVNEFKEAGSYELTFNAESLSSGIYFYRLEAGEFSDVKKLVLIR